MPGEEWGPVVRAIWRERADNLSNEARSVFTALCLRAEAPAWTCWPSVGTIGLDTSLPRRTVQRAIVELVRQALVAVDLHGAGRANRYRLLAVPDMRQGGAGAGAVNGARAGPDPPETRQGGAVRAVRAANSARLSTNSARLSTNSAKNGVPSAPGWRPKKTQEKKTHREENPPEEGNIVPNSREQRDSTAAGEAGALPPLSGVESPETRLLSVVAAIVGACGRPANDAERSRYRWAATQLEQAGVDAAEVVALAGAFRSRWPHLPLTPVGLASNVTTLRAPAPVAATGRGRRRTLRETLAVLDEGDDA